VIDVERARLRLRWPETTSSLSSDEARVSSRGNSADLRAARRVVMKNMFAALLIGATAFTLSQPATAQTVQAGVKGMWTCRC